MTSRISSEQIKLRGLVLGQFPQLLKLHKALVGKKYISEEDFWEIEKEYLDQVAQNLSQKKGNIGSFGSLVKKTTNSKGDIKIVITADSINAVFQQYPLVKIAHQDLVTTKKMTDSQFWHQYYQSSFTKDDPSSFGFGSSILSEDNALEKYYRQTKAEKIKAQSEESNANGNDNLHELSHLINITNDDRFDYGNRELARTLSEKTQETLALMHKYNEMSGMVLKESSTSTSISREKFSENDEERELALRDLNLDNNANKRGIIVFSSLERRCEEEEEESISKDLDSAISIDDFDSKSFDMLKNYQPSIERVINNPMSYEDYKKSWNDHFSPPPNLKNQISKLACISLQELVTYCSQIIEILKLFWGNYPPQSDLQQSKLIRIGQALERIKKEITELPIVDEEKFIVDSIIKDTIAPLDYAIELLKGQEESEKHANKKTKSIE